MKETKTYTEAMNNSINSRRHFVKNLVLTSFGFSVFSRCAPDDFLNRLCSSSENLISDPNNYLTLPAGFSYKVISRSGDLMDDGFYVPGKPDGMGTFKGEHAEEVIIVRNHENNPSPKSNGPFGQNNELLQNIDPSKIYDAGGMISPGLGGTTTMVYDEINQVLVSQHLSLAGTFRNCAGGITPWNSWLTCEEDVTSSGGHAEKNHGYVFEVPANSQGLVEPVPLLDMGRFNHEAVAVDPKTGIVYLTEDRPDGLFYRFIPNVPEVLSEGGQLQILSVKNNPQCDTRNWDMITVAQNQEMDVEWIDIRNDNSKDDNMRYKGFDKGGACFARGEGIWFGDNELYFACTNGGKNKTGQIFKYKLSPDEGSENAYSKPAKLILHIESTGSGVLNMCDNLTITPWGDLMVCEDNGKGNRILQIKKNGSIVAFGCNHSSESEFAGIVFSPSGKTLFVNVQQNGDTIAITGPWETLL